MRKQITRELLLAQMGVTVLTIKAMPEHVLHEMVLAPRKPKYGKKANKPTGIAKQRRDSRKLRNKKRSR